MHMYIFIHFFLNRKGFILYVFVLQPFVISSLKNQYSMAIFPYRYILFILMITHCSVVFKHQNLFYIHYWWMFFRLFLIFIVSKNAAVNVPKFSIDQVLFSWASSHAFSKQVISRVVISLEAKTTIHYGNIFLCITTSSLQIPKTLVVVHWITVSFVLTSVWWTKVLAVSATDLQFKVRKMNFTHDIVKNVWGWKRWCMWNILSFS